jgi:CRP-like cAMP-binding protein
MSEQIDYTAPIGQPNTGGSYSEMVPGNPAPKETFPEDTFGGDHTGLQEAADEVVARRQPTRDEVQAKKPLERAYQQAGGENAGEPMPANETVSPAQGAHDLTAIRAAEKAQELAVLEAMLRSEIDGSRGQQTTENLGAQELSPQELAELTNLTPDQVAAKWETLTLQQQDNLRARTEATLAAVTNNSVQDLLQKNPQLASAMQEEIQRTQQHAAAQVEQEKGRYIQGLASNAVTAIQSVAIAYPELASVNDLNQIPVVINTVAQSNPDRAKAMVGHIQQVAVMVQQAQAAQGQYQAQQYAAQQQQFQKWSEAHDNAFDKHFDSVVPDRAQQAEIKKEALAMLQDQGLSHADLQALWQTPAFRSLASQKTMLDAALYRRSKSTAKQKSIKPVPTVQRPGSGTEYVRNSEWTGQREALAKLDRTGSAKDAAAYLVAKRAAARRG